MKKLLFKIVSAVCVAAMAINVYAFAAGNANADSDQVEAFVERGYSLILQRESDATGMQYWADKLRNNEIDAAHMVMGFLGSDEYTSRHNSHEATVEILYNVMLSRNSDPTGLAEWTGYLDCGVSYEYIINGFSGSQEFMGLCNSYGITAGTIQLTESRDQNIKTTKFVNLCYQNILGRAADSMGLNNWTSRINNHEIYPEELILGFLGAPECAPLIESDEGYVDTLYRAVFGRNADEAGREYWLNSISEHNRQFVFDGFINSAEFAALIAEYDLTLRPTPQRLTANTRMVCLTFDDGPYSPVTNRILDNLEAVGGHATFFVVGDRVPSYLSCVTRAEALGCEIANHTYDHRSTLTSMSGETVAWEIAGCNDAITAATGHGPSIMRPVGGAYNETVSANVGLPMIIWSLDTQDWRYRDSAHVASAILDNVSDGDIILMHDLYVSTADAMDIVIPELVRRGYTLVTVSEMAEARGLNMQAGTAYYSVRP